MKMPVFDGDIRDYPRCKSDFLQQVVPEMKSMGSTAYVLRSCLTKVPLDIVKDVNDDSDEMWKRLDEKYGKPSKLADVVMYDIKKLRAIREGDDKRFIDLVDVVEKDYLDLLRVGVEQEISNTSTVSIFEEKLPKDTRREWSREVNRTNSKVEESNKFPYLLNFLLKEKQIIEYESMSFRTGGAPTKGYANHLDENGDDSNARKDEQTVQWKPHFQCWIHSTNKHAIGECKVYLGKQPEDRVKTLKEYRACYFCLKIGHRSSGCKCRNQCEIDECEMYHHQSLHEAHIAGITFHYVRGQNEHVNESKNRYSGQCLFPLMAISSDTIPSSKVNVVWDSGATFSLITFKKAIQLNLIGEEISIFVIKVGVEKETIQSYACDLPLRDKSGKVIIFRVYGIDKISTDVKYISVKGVLHLFHDIKKLIFKGPLVK